MDLNGDWPALIVPADQKGNGPMPLRFDENLGGVSGKYMVLTGRRHKGKGFGEAMDDAAVAYAPGWKAKDGLKIRLVNIRYAMADA